jgi:hypothetical protein
MGSISLPSPAPKGNPVHDELADQRRIARAIHDEALTALSLTRNNEGEITSTRQLRILEDAAWKILSMHIDDRSVNDAAQRLLARVAAARQWTWVDPVVVTGLTILALLAGIGAAVLAGTDGNIVLAVVGGVLSSVLLSVVVLRYRRQNWRIRAEQISPMIWQHGV